MKTINIPDVILELELPKEVYLPIVEATNEGNPELVSQRLALLKVKVRKQRRLLARKYHPDKGGSLEKMQRINALCDTLLRAKVFVNRPPPRPVFRTFYYSFTYNMGTSSAIYTQGSTT